MNARRGSRRRPLLVLLALCVTAPVAGVVAPSERAAATVGPPEFTASRTMSRTHLTNGQDEVVDTRSVTVTVSRTTNLRAHQSVEVSWTGAHPTGGVYADQNSGDAKSQEYPVVILQCLGAETPADQVDPTRCWTSTSSERFQDSFNTAFPPWRLDRYAANAERQAVSGQPQPRPSNCFTPSPSEHWVPFRAATGVVFGGGSGGCAGQAPEAANVGGLNLPSNTTYGVTNANGSGTAKFDVWTREVNASLGCSEAVQCSIVVVPIMGVSCDAVGASLPPADQVPADIAGEVGALCRADGTYQPGQLTNAGITPDIAVTGTLWWSASNWQNRITVPLSFGASPSVCDVIDDRAEIDIYGSELMTQAMFQWSPRFCLDATQFKLKHIQTPEPQARNLLRNGGVHAVFTSDVSDPTMAASTIVAPVAVTGFAIAFTVDDAAGNALATLRLTPRLLAKLLTESYPAINAMKTEYAPLSANPLNMSLDPEFVALNPGVTQGVPASQSASTLLALSSDSDVMRAITSYITNDPEARAWLDGAPDPWGMVVNPNYRGMALPTSSWPLLDTFEPPLLYASHTNDCLSAQPVPYLPLVAAPLSRLQSIALNMQFSIANSQTVCKTIVDGSLEGSKLVPLGRQTIGFRFMIGVTSLADAERYGLQTAALQTTVDPATPAAFDSASGRTFVAPSDESLRAMSQILVNDPATRSWPIPYASLRSDPAAAAAYPGTMVVYLQAPAAGLSPVDATNLTTFLRFAAADGQAVGVGTGQLPQGYLALTVENHLQDLAAATVAGAAAVHAQVPVPVTAPPASVVARPTATTVKAVAAPTVTTPIPVVASQADPSGVAIRPEPITPDIVRVPVPASTPATAPPLVIPTRRGVVAIAQPLPPAGRTLEQASSPAGRTVPLLLVVGLLGLLGAAGVNVVTTRRAKR